MIASWLMSAPDLSIQMVAAFLTSYAILVAFGNKFIAFLHSRQGLGQPIRENGPQSHLLTKKGTPTMGGLLILLSIAVSCLLWCQLNNIFVWLCLAVLAVYGTTGFIDDYVKVKKQTPDAMTAKMKLLIQFATAFLVVIIISLYTPVQTRHILNIPYIDFALNLGWFYLIFAVIVISGSSNAVNLSDGLDGLAAGLCLITFSAFAAVCAVAGLPEITGSYNVFVPGCEEVGVVCCATAGACLGFLWFNSSPAKVFMGDTGSLALGALLGTCSVMAKQEILLAVIGFVFVAETLSVMIQVFWYKKTKTRVFLMAPIHHHFEQLGWKETMVVARFRIVAVILAVVGLTALIY